MTRALLMSSSRKDNLGYLEHADPPTPDHPGWNEP
jgi:hypothetical protein